MSPRRFISIGALLLTMLFYAGPSGAQSEETEGVADHSENSGQDPANPIRRFDLRLQYQQVDDDLEQVILTPRMDWPFALDGGWRLNTRIDVPLITNDIPSLDNVDGDWEFGLSDVLLQGLLIKPLERSAFIVGSQVILPTATQDQFGSGKLHLLPTMGMIFYPSSLPPGSFLGGIVRYDFDVAGDDDRNDISALLIQPIANFALPDRWFITFSPELRIDFEENGKVFLPFDVTIGKKVTPTTVMSLEFKHEVIDEVHEYDWSLEGRIGFFF